ncbi:MAG: uroporphyrinogen-III C-methyltransferase [Oscillospiraceae bacterium]|nr:uroporphyrinogen-III C-methyltransferase [Oscillospiraceae bacterium]
MSKGKVYIVGSGCGDADLITIRGAYALGQADCIVYDDLIDKRLLGFAPENAEAVFVGKRMGKHSETQDVINGILVKKALEGKTVVRLKGGDPFVFGRGGEEAEALSREDIPFEIIPGISSCIAVPELAGIPVTHRRVSRSFHVITAHTAEDIPDGYFGKYAALDGTLVFLMGLNSLKRLTDELMDGGLSADMPAAVISKGGSPEQRTVRGRLADIAEYVQKENITAPAVILVGETAALDYSNTLEKKLDGISVTVTGTKDLVDKLTKKIYALGGSAYPLPVVRISEYEDNARFDRALENISDYSYIALTSANGAEIFLERMKRLNIDVRRLSRHKIAVVGRPTGERLKSAGIIPDLVPDTYTVEALGRLLAENVKNGERVLILRAEQGSVILNKILDGSGIEYDDIKIYDTLPCDAPTAHKNISTDFLTFASGSGVRAFFGSGYTVSDRTKIVCIGNITAEELLKIQTVNRENIFIADCFTADGIIEKTERLTKNEKIQKTSQQ